MLFVSNLIPAIALDFFPASTVLRFLRMFFLILFKSEAKTKLAGVSYNKNVNTYCYVSSLMCLPVNTS